MQSFVHLPDMKKETDNIEFPILGEKIERTIKVS